MSKEKELITRFKLLINKGKGANEVAAIICALAKISEEKREGLENAAFLIKPEMRVDKMIAIIQVVSEIPVEYKQEVIHLFSTQVDVLGSLDSQMDVLDFLDTLHYRLVLVIRDLAVWLNKNDENTEEIIAEKIAIIRKIKPLINHSEIGPENILALIVALAKIPAQEREGAIEKIASLNKSKEIGLSTDEIVRNLAEIEFEKRDNIMTNTIS